MEETSCGVPSVREFRNSTDFERTVISQLADLHADLRGLHTHMAALYKQGAEHADRLTKLELERAAREAVAAGESDFAERLTKLERDLVAREAVAKERRTEEMWSRIKTLVYVLAAALAGYAPHLVEKITAGAPKS